MITSLLAQRWHDRDESGASAVEYGLLATAVAALIVVIVYALGGMVTEMFGQSCDVIELHAQTGSGCGRS